MREKRQESEHNITHPDGVCSLDPNDPLADEEGEIMDYINAGMKFAEGLEKRGIDKFK